VLRRASLKEEPVILSLLVLTACHRPDLSITGMKTSPFFPTDGSRTATYVSDDATIADTLQVDKIEPTETIDDREVVTFEYARSGESLTSIGDVKWSSVSGSGIKIFGYSEGTGGEMIMFDTPVDFTDDDDYEKPNETITTTTNGYTFTSTFIDLQDCPVDWGLDWIGCMHIKLDDGDGDDTAGPFFAGEYWLVTRYGPAWMKLTGDTANWNLADYNWDSGG
jgi:hypothetical protein